MSWIARIMMRLSLSYNPKLVLACRGKEPGERTYFLRSKRNQGNKNMGCTLIIPLIIPIVFKNYWESENITLVLYYKRLHIK
jgi:hypothetical protein